MKRLASLWLPWRCSPGARESQPGRTRRRATREERWPTCSRSSRAADSSSSTAARWCVRTCASSGSRLGVAPRILAQILASHGLRCADRGGVEALAIVPAASQRSPESGSPSGFARRRAEPRCQLSVAHLPCASCRTTRSRRRTRRRADAGRRGPRPLRAVGSPRRFHSRRWTSRSSATACEGCHRSRAGRAMPERPHGALDSCSSREGPAGNRRGVRDARRTSVEPGPTRLPSPIRAAPRAVENVFRAVQALPGIVPQTSSRAAWSCAVLARQNLTILDGLEIYNPFRLEGLVSAFNPDTVEDFAARRGFASARLRLPLVFRSGDPARRKARSQARGSAA